MKVGSLTISENKETYYLVIDQGGHATRAIVFDSVGATVCTAEALIKTITSNGLKVEHDPDDLLNSVYSVLDQVHKKLGCDYQKISQAGLATQRSSIVCWSKNTGKALSPIISWQDRRTSHSISQYDDHAQYIHDVTGLYLNPHYGATKMRWCLDNIADLEFEKNSLCIAPMVSFILFHLLDNSPFVVDPANASRSLLMNFKTLTWDPKLLEIFSIPKSVLPSIELSRFVFGDIVRHSHRIPLSICTGDQSAAVFSQGKIENDEVFVNAGTGAFVLRGCEGIPDLKNEKILASVVYADSESVKYVIEGTVNGAGRALQWFSEQSGVVEYESQLDGWCAKFDDPPVFFNAISGIGSPFWISEYESHFSRDADIEEKFVAVLESIIFLIVENIKCMKNISGDVNAIRIAGGIAKSQSFCQKLANLLKVNVIVDEDVEATVKGVFHLLSPIHIRKNTGDSALFHSKNDLMLSDRYRYWRKHMYESFPAI